MIREFPGVTLHRGDCLDVMRSIEAGSVDAVVTDPPYCSGSFSEAGRNRAKGQGLRSETIRGIGWFVGDNMGTAGISWLLRSIATEAVRILRPSGSLLCFCDWRMYSALQPAIESAGLRSQSLIVWDKGSAGLGCGFRAQHELVMHFTNGSPEYHDASTGNVLKSSRVNHQAREHQTQKPVDLIERLIRVACPPGGTVLDPFIGSGTTALAAINTGRKCIGIERDEGYYGIACRRVTEALDKTALLNPIEAQ